MKKKAIILVIGAMTLFSACHKDLTSLNTDPKNPLSIPSYTLFTNAQHNISNTVSSSNVNLNIFRLIEQQWQETTYTDESDYNIATRQIPDGVWNAFYQTVLINLEQFKKVAPVDVTDAAQLKNEIAIADIMEVYSYYYLLTTFGNIPYSQALDITKPFPKYDDAKTVYGELLTRLDADIAALNTSGASFGTADIVYNGDPSKWLKFANSFKIKMGITIADSDPATAKATVEAAYKTGNTPNPIIASNGDNALFQYLSSVPNTNPIWVDLVESGRQDFVACSTIMSYLVSPVDSVTVLDPRLPYYFTVNNNDQYSGGAPGVNCSFGGNSKPSGNLLVASSIGKITNPDFPGDLADYAETELNLAEAAERGWAVGASAATYYANGVKASIEYWTGNTDDIANGANAYLTAHPYVDINSIALQKYLALYNRGWDAWIEQRRLDFPVLPAVDPNYVEGPFPVRFTYPLNEQDVNVINYNAASTAIGGDKTSTRLWFDTKGPF
jgi:hypothetical protein